MMDVYHEFFDDLNLCQKYYHKSNLKLQLVRTLIIETFKIIYFYKNYPDENTLQHIYIVRGYM